MSDIRRRYVVGVTVLGVRVRVGVIATSLEKAEEAVLALTMEQFLARLTLRTLATSVGTQQVVGESEWEAVDVYVGSKK